MRKAKQPWAILNNESVRQMREKKGGTDLEKCGTESLSNVVAKALIRADVIKEVITCEVCCPPTSVAVEHAVISLREETIESCLERLIGEGRGISIHWLW